MVPGARGTKQIKHNSIDMNTNTYDLIIIGGGILGTFHAYHALKKRIQSITGRKRQLSGRINRSKFRSGCTIRHGREMV